ncbi:geranylgerany transferase type II beta subunit [Tothia fuscella]|uniref:Geranylgeranyl transferase type-2 subunit beta n=1 Tax=Tothia fuscella TaxID=1048955 RepID=A0A9P4P0U9_9PEZI|nr:geranylgerany transferase type II beta subunit [Tothia fuscella]
MALVSGPGRGGSGGGHTLPEELHLYIDKHVHYIQTLDTRKDEYEYWLTEHLRLNGLYWGLTALHLLGRPDVLKREEVLDFVFSCMHEDGGFGAAPGHDAHMLYTASAVQILATLDAFGDLETRVCGGRMRIGQFIASLQDRKTGTIHGDKYGEPDTRFIACAFMALSLLCLLPIINVPLSIRYIQSCANPDGGYGSSPGAESHSGQIFACLSALSIANALRTVNTDRLAGWLSERQITSGPGVGGLNGRPEKKEDVCYSWWVLSSLAMLSRRHWVDGEALKRFILSCQDEVNGGISDRPGDMVDVFHTVFGVAGLSLLGYEGLEEVDPVYCMPRSITRRILGK